MTLIDTHLAVGLLALLGAGGLATTGWAPSTRAKQEALPVSVRTNPASYRPVYTGYHAIVRTSSGTGGGYRSGK